MFSSHPRFVLYSFQTDLSLHAAVQTSHRHGSDLKHVPFSAGCAHGSLGSVYSLGCVWTILDLYDVSLITWHFSAVGFLAGVFALIPSRWAMGPRKTMRSNLVRATAGLPLQLYVLSSCWHNWEMRTQRMSWTLRRTVRKCGERFFRVITWRLLKPPPKKRSWMMLQFLFPVLYSIVVFLSSTAGAFESPCWMRKKGESFTFHHS